jgi:hypothetical protein
MVDADDTAKHIIANHHITHHITIMFTSASCACDDMMMTTNPIQPNPTLVMIYEDEFDTDIDF